MHVYINARLIFTNIFREWDDAYPPVLVISEKIIAAVNIGFTTWKRCQRGLLGFS